MVRLLSLFLIALYATSSSAFADVTVTFENESFPMRLVAQKGDDKPVTLMRPGTLTLSGGVTLSVESYPTGGYYVLARFRHNDGAWTDITNQAALTLKDGDRLTVRQVHIVAPGNAALVPFKGGSILVSLMYPAAVKNPADFGGPEEFRSSALFVAKYGSKAIAKRLAEQAATKTTQDAYGNYRGDQQISVIRQSNSDGSVMEAQAKATVEDLAEAIQAGLIELQLRGWHGEITKAKQILAE